MPFLDQLLTRIIKIRHMVSFALELVAFPGRLYIVQKIRIRVVQKVWKPREVTVFGSRKRWKFHSIQSGSGLLKNLRYQRYVGDSPIWDSWRIEEEYESMQNHRRQNLLWVLDVWISKSLNSLHPSSLTSLLLSHFLTFSRTDAVFV